MGKRNERERERELCIHTSSLQVWCPNSCAMSSGVLSCLLRCVGSAPALKSNFMASALSCLAETWRAVSPSAVGLSIPPAGMFWTIKSTMCKLLPISRSIAKCKAVSPISWQLIIIIIIIIIVLCNTKSKFYQHSFAVLVTVVTTHLLLFSFEKKKNYIIHQWIFTEVGNEAARSTFSA